MSKTVFALLTVLCFTSVFAAFNPPKYSQVDSRWKNQILGFGPSTIGSAGCLLTSVSSMIAGNNVNVDGALPNPSTMNNWLKKNGGFSGDLFVWGSISKLGFAFEGKVSNIVDIIKNYNTPGKYVILNVNQGRHYVLATGRTNDGFNVMDPGYSKTFYKNNEIVSASIYRH